MTMIKIIMMMIKIIMMIIMIMMMITNALDEEWDVIGDQELDEQNEEYDDQGDDQDGGENKYPRTKYQQPEEKENKLRCICLIYFSTMLQCKAIISDDAQSYVRFIYVKLFCHVCFQMCPSIA